MRVRDSRLRIAALARYDVSRPGDVVWKLGDAKADAKSAWVTMKLDFFRIPRYMKQFPFAHTLTITYRVQEFALTVHTRIAT